MGYSGGGYPGWSGSVAPQKVAIAKLRRELINFDKPKSQIEKLLITAFKWP